MIEALALVARYAAAGNTTYYPLGETVPVHKAMGGDWAEVVHRTDKRGRRAVRMVYEVVAFQALREWIHWQSGTAQLLPRLIARRTRGPLFLTHRKAPAGTPTLDVCPETGRARMSYRRAEEIFEGSTRLLANPLASPEDIEDLDGWTLHRLRHSALTHDAEGGTSTPMLLARSRHASDGPWSGTPAPASTPSPSTSPNETPPHVAARDTRRSRLVRAFLPAPREGHPLRPGPPLTTAA
ncbi:hypothetical protein ACIQCF_36340 [Streptomyces sp. NPDC088353]|uniref:hypothetical protein n=1 Tax=unclassified Streptomyces TaxID=2593676 RepID=UPI003685DF15